MTDTITNEFSYCSRFLVVTISYLLVQKKNLLDYVDSGYF